MKHATVLSPEAEAVQGRPAGLVSRIVAVAVDALVVASLLGAAYLGTTGLLFASRPRAFTPPVWPGGVVLAVTGAFALVYLTASWWVGGRTYGCALMGLRVVDVAGEALPLARAFLRAGICLLFPFGLAWSAVDPRGRAVHDLVVRSSVIYDWRRSHR